AVKSQSPQSINEDNFYNLEYYESVDEYELLARGFRNYDKKLIDVGDLLSTQNNDHNALNDKSSIYEEKEVSQIPTLDKYKNALDGLVDELRAANMVRCCESLLSLTHDLKTTLLLNDTQTLLKLQENRKNDLLSRTQKIKNKVLQLNEAVTQAIWEMESVLGGEGSSNQQLDPSKM
ncbi:5302_t:CDS:2, partial [Entrophospora sp. SA101]